MRSILFCSLSIFFSIFAFFLASFSSALHLRQAFRALLRSSRFNLPSIGAAQPWGAVELETLDDTEEVLAALEETEEEEEVVAEELDEELVADDETELLCEEETDALEAEDDVEEELPSLLWANAAVAMLSTSAPATTAETDCMFFMKVGEKMTDGVYTYSRAPHLRKCRSISRCDFVSGRGLSTMNICTPHLQSACMLPLGAPWITAEPCIHRQVQKEHGCCCTFIPRTIPRVAPFRPAVSVMHFMNLPGKSQCSG